MQNDSLASTAAGRPAPAVTTVSDPSAPATSADAMAGRPEAGPGAARPFLRVVRGNPTAEELAAVTVVLAAKARAAAAAAAAASSAPGTPSRRSNWAAKSRLLRESVSPAPGGWKRSAFPR